jgi:Icc-related predicted phosphoesterase
LLLIAGDLSFSHKGSVFDEAKFIHGEFMPWCEEIAARGTKIVAIAGNHDFLFQKAPDLIPHRTDVWTYLQDEELIWNGLKIYGSPWQPPFHDWAFNLPEEELAKKWAKIPDDVDILLTHGPPKGCGDYMKRDGHVGSWTLRDRILQLDRSILHVCGHIHVGYGTYSLGKALVLNASIVNEGYTYTNPPIIIDTEVHWRRLNARSKAGDSNPKRPEDASG